MNYDKLAIRLVLLYMEWTMAQAESGQKSKRAAVAYARLEGACQAACAMGLGFTPAQVQMVVLGACVGKEIPPASAYNVERKLALDTLAAEVAEGLAGLA